MKGLILLAFCGCAFGALYPVKEEYHAGMDEIHHGDNDKTHEHHDVPDHADTLHEGIQGKGKKKASRAAPVPFDPANAATKQFIVDTHNTLRAAEGAADMQEIKWSDELAAQAKKWASQCTFRHPMNSPDEIKQYLSTSQYDQCGQNIAFTSADSSWDFTIKNQWAGEKKSFLYDANPTGVVGHYTQIVWAKTYQVGCAYAKCSFGDYFVCNYGPPGNFSPGQYKPFTKGSPCSKCSKKCKNKQLCQNPCGYNNGYTNCDDLIKDPTNQCKDPNGFAVPQCKATCNCKVQGLMY